MAGENRQLRPDWRTVPRRDRLDRNDPAFDASMAAHRRAVDADQPGYGDPTTGLFVMTAVNLANRGWCCDRGCRHCPYEPGPYEPGPATKDV